MKQFFSILILGLLPGLLSAQTYDGKKSNSSTDKVLYTVGYAHLDTEWNWDYPQTIDFCIRNIMEENFRLFEMYPDYVFNFTGSRRYHMMKEYYPEMYEKVKKYINEGRWHVSGSSVDEGEVNMSSSEALIRQVLYGNGYFKREFGVVSSDYMLPDCFGFLSNMPTIWSHCGLLGFSTQKLTWRSANGVPFNVGIWKGPDGKGIIAALNATNYVGNVVKRLDLDDYWNNRIEENRSKYGFSFDYRYYGVGDEGGAPRPNDVKHAVESLHNPDSKIKVLLTSSDQMYKDITPEIREKLPVYSGDLLLIEHSAGSLTSQSFMKRFNRKNELLAYSAEQLASAAGWLKRTEYPKEKLNNSWELVLGSQFHDILPGTSIPKAYEYAWNDEFIAANGFAEVLKSSVSVLTVGMNTQGVGRAVVVYNPVAAKRQDVVSATLEYDHLPKLIQVIDPNGKIVPSQIIDREGNSISFIFLADIPSSGMCVFEVKETEIEKINTSELKISDQSLENEYYRVEINTDGDIRSIYDKTVKKELLKAPASLQFQHEKPVEWPSWNMDWNDRKEPPIDFMNKNVSIRILENGPVRVALEVVRSGQGSTINQIISLASGEAGKHLEVTNTIDWKSRGVSLKAAFPLSAVNEKTTYNLGVGTIQREKNNSVKFEVPAKEWFDLTDQSGEYGVTILEDCKYGSDMPDNNTLRLTLMYTPETDQSFPYQRCQDWGTHQFRYGVYSHENDWKKGRSYLQGRFFNLPLIAFEVSKHDGSLGKSLSILSLNTPSIGLMALKKMENDDYYIVRFNDLAGNDTKNVVVKFMNAIEDAFEVNGQEQKIGNSNFKGNELKFDLSHYSIKSFAVKFKAPDSESYIVSQKPVSLPYNQDVFSHDDNRSDGSFNYNFTYPAELIPDEITSEGICFKMGEKTDEQSNAISCDGQSIKLPDGNYNKIYILAASDEDTGAKFIIDGNPRSLSIQNWSGYIGQFFKANLSTDSREVESINQPFVKTDNLAWFGSHRHNGYPSKNESYNYCYMFKYELAVPYGSKEIIVPANKNIKILAITVADTNDNHIKALSPLFDNFADENLSGHK